MNNPYDVAIIGGGIVGVCTAYELACKGAKVVLLEKGNIGEEQSGKNWGWVRRLGRDRREIELAQLSLQRWKELQQKTELGFRQNGLLRIFKNDQERDQVLEHARALEDHNYNYSFLESRDVPASGIIKSHEYKAGALFAPNEACAEPDIATKAISDLATAAGAIIKTNAAVKELIIEGSRIIGVQTQDTHIRADKVLVAAGAWSQKLLKQAKIKLPQAYVITNVASTDDGAEFMPTTLLRSSSIAVRKRIDGGLTIGTPGHLQALPTFDTIKHMPQFYKIFKMMSSDILNKESMIALKYLTKSGPFNIDNDNAPLSPMPSEAPLNKAISDVQQSLSIPIKINKSWAGVIDGTPDAVPILGRLPEYDNLYIATGFSGHGFGLGPGTGIVMSQLLLKGKAEISISSLKINRFDEPLEISVTF